MSDHIIRLDQVSKRFARSLGGQRKIHREGMLRDLFGVRRKRRPQLREGEFWGLDNVSLEVKPGEAIGLIGPNGAGKSTLLKMIAGTIVPDYGYAERFAPISKLMSLSAEFQANLTGRENIFLVGAVRGLSRRALKTMIDEIIDFAELGEFIDAPFYTYSQGMRLRLGFAVAVHADAPIMLIDEVLAVGDIRFRQKCLRKLTELQRQATYFLASHSNGYISQFCERTLVMEEGAVLFDGNTSEAIAFAERDVSVESPTSVGSAGELRLGRMINEEAVGEVDAWWLGRENEPVHTLALGSSLRFRVCFRVRRTPQDILNVHVQIGGRDTSTLMSFSNRSSRVEIKALAGDLVQLTARIDGVDLAAGKHGCAISIFDGVELLYRSDLPTLTVEGRGRKIWGEVQLRPDWELEVVSEDEAQPIASFGTP